MKQAMNSSMIETRFQPTVTDHQSLTSNGVDHDDAGFALFPCSPPGHERALSRQLQNDESPQARENPLTVRGQTVAAVTLTDFQLAQAAAAGDQRAFERLYRKHHQKVYSLCLRMLKNQADAEDATQDVFVRVYRKIGMFQGDSAFTTWLYSLTVNSVLMNLRTKRRRQRDQPTDNGMLERWAEGRVLWHHQEMPIIDRIALKQALARLPAGYHRVFVLHDVEGFRHEEVGHILGISPGTSKSQLHKARARLKKLLLAKPRVTGQTLANATCH